MIKFIVTTSRLALIVALGGLGANSRAQTYTAQPLPSFGLLSQNPFVFTGLIQTDNGYGSGAVVKNPRVVFSCAHVVFDDRALSGGLDPWLSTVVWYRAWFSGSPPSRLQGQLLRGYIYYVSYSDAAAKNKNSLAAFDLDFVVYYAYENTALGGYAGWWNDGVANLKGSGTKLITGYPLGLYKEGLYPESYSGERRFLMHYVGPFTRSYTEVLGNYFGVNEVSAAPGNSGGPVWVSNGTDYLFAGVHVSGAVRSLGDATDFAGAYGTDASSFALIDAAIAASSGTVTAPLITSQPTSRRVNLGQFVSFSVGVSGQSLTYRWLKNGVTISGASTGFYSIAGVALSDAGTYQVIISNAGGEARSAVVTLSVDAPPVINTPPLSSTVNEGQAAQLTVSATGSGALSYRWYQGQSGNTSTPVAGATSASLTTPPLTATTSFWVRVTDGGGLSSDSPTATITVTPSPPKIVTQPASVAVQEGQNLSFSVMAQGSGLIRYQWYWDGFPIRSAESPSYSIGGVQRVNGGRYTVSVSNDAGSVTSSAAELTVNYPPAISVQPTLGGPLLAGASAAFSVTASGMPAPTFQWRKGGALIAGATNASFEIRSIGLADAGSYDVIVQNNLGSVRSLAAKLEVNQSPLITEHPVSQSSAPGGSISLKVTALGAPQLQYQWRKDGVVLPSATSASLALENVQAAAAGRYQATASNALGSVTSTVATVTVSGISVPVVTADLYRYVVDEGGSATIKAIPTGATMLQWRRNGRPIQGATAAQLEVTAAKPLKDNGWYQLEASNESGATVSKPIFVAVAGGYRVHAWGDPAVIGVPAGLDDIVGISAGASHSVAIKRDGSLVSWGSSGSEISGVVPTGLGKVVSVAAGNGFNVALIEDGSLVSWGTSEVLGVPSDPNGFVAVAAGVSHALAIKSDGSVAAWGYNNKGQTTVPSGLKEVTSIAAGEFFSLASKADGTVVMWPSYPTSSSLAMPAGLAGVSSVSASSSQALVLRSSGTCQGWGSLGGNTLGGTRNTQYLSGLGGLVSIAAGELFGLFLYADGRVYATGYGVGQSVVPAQLGGVIAIAAGKNHSLALSPYRKPLITKPPQPTSGPPGAAVAFTVSAEAGGVNLSYQWRKYGQPIAGATQQTYTISPVVSGDAGSYDVVVSNYLGSATSATADLSVWSSPAAILSGPVSVSVSGGESASFNVSANGSPSPTYQWFKDGLPISGATKSTLDFARARAADAGSYSVEVQNVVSGVAFKQTSSSALLNVNTIAPTLVNSPSGRAVLPGGSTEFSVVATGSELAFQWLRDGVAIPNANSASLTLTAVDASDEGVYVARVSNPATRVRVVVNRKDHAAYLFEDGALWVGGINVYGQIGDGTTINRGKPVKVANQVSNVSVGESHTAFVKNGTLYTMGYNFFGQLGDGTKNPKSVPVAIANDVVSVSCGQDHTMFVKTDGSLWGFGRNTNGQLGDGTQTDKSLPIKVGLGVSSVSTSHAHTLFIKQDRTLWAMGWNGLGQLGDGTKVDRSSPVQVGSDVVVAAAGFFHSMFAKRDYSLWATGYNDPGQLGDGTKVDKITPVKVADGVVNVSAGERFSVFVNIDGSLFGVGRNENGVLGFSIKVDLTKPVKVASDAVSVSAGFETLMFTSKDGSLWCSGLPSGWSGMVGASGRLNVPTRLIDSGVASSAAKLSMSVAPTITSSPLAVVMASLGGSQTFSIGVDSPTPVTYQWFKNGALISGATSSSYTVSSAQLDSVGKYSVVATNSAGSVSSSPASLEIKQQGSSASHSVSGSAYVPGQTLLVTNSMSFSGSPTALRWSVLLPSGWKLASYSAIGVVFAPSIGQTDLIEWVLSPTTSSGELSFSYLLEVPPSELGTRELASLVSVSSPDAQRFLARPDPLRLSQVLAHSADTDRNGKLSLLELTRVIELYNTRNGTTRSGCYSLANSVSEDGFASAPERTPGSSVSLARVHSADSNRDGKISLTELTRVIELYNTRTGTTRTGQYRLQTGTEDGFAPSP